MVELIKSTSKKVKENKIGFFIFILINVVLKNYLEKNYFEINGYILYLLNYGIDFLAVFFLGKLVFKEKLKDLLRPKIFINLALIYVAVLGSAKLKYSYTVPGINSIFRILDIIAPFFIYSLIILVKRKEKIYFSILDIFRYFYEKKCLMILLIIDTINMLMIPVPKNEWLYTNLRYNYEKFSDTENMVCMIIITLIESVMLLVVYNLVDTDWENKATKYLSGKFSKLSCNLFGAISVILIWVAIGLGKNFEFSHYYFREYSIGALLGMMIFSLIIFYLIKAFEIKGILKIFNIESKLIEKESIKSCFKLILKLIGLDIVFYIVSLMIVSIVNYYSFESAFRIVSVPCILVILYLIYYSLTIDFLKAKLNNPNLKYFELWRNIPFMLFISGIVYVMLYNVQLFKYERYVTDGLAIGIVMLYLLSNLTYFILKENGYLEEGE